MTNSSFREWWVLLFENGFEDGNEMGQKAWS
jgi:hypothetical protein